MSKRTEIVRVLGNARAELFEATLSLAEVDTAEARAKIEATEARLRAASAAYTKAEKAHDAAVWTVLSRAGLKGPGGYTPHLKNIVAEAAGVPWDPTSGLFARAAAAICERTALADPEAAKLAAELHEAREAMGLARDRADRARWSLDMAKGRVASARDGVAMLEARLHNYDARIDAKARGISPVEVVARLQALIRGELEVPLGGDAIVSEGDTIRNG